MMTRNHSQISVFCLLLTLLFLAGCASSPKPPKNAAQLQLPVSGAKITSTFGPRGRSFHEGMDFAISRGTPVVAAAEGKVVFAGWRGNYGRLVIIDHGSRFTTWYAHLDEIAVKKGDRLVRAALIGTVGTSGNATGPHVHFETRLGERAVDPADYLR